MRYWGDKITGILSVQALLTTFAVCSKSDSPDAAIAGEGTMITFSMTDWKELQQKKSLRTAL